MELYKKYRPNSLEEIHGNKETVNSLKKQLKNPEKSPRAFLFHGGTGCGKTTLARIIAKELKVKGSDYQEIDVADFNGIETARTIRKDMGFKPLESPFRVFVLDEAHMLTTQAQNGLLKSFEDTPSHVRFILCTTDPQKLIPTLKGRCSVYQVENLSNSIMVKLLQSICKAEKEKVKKDILQVIAEGSEGHSRNAIQTLEQVLSVEADKRMKIAKQIIELKKQVIDLCFAMMGWKRGGWKEVREILNSLKEQKIETEKIRRAVIGYASNQLLKKDDKKCALVLEEFIEPFYNSGFPGLVLAAYAVTKG